MFLFTGQVDLKIFPVLFQSHSSTYRYLLTYGSINVHCSSTFCNVCFPTANNVHLSMEGLSVSPPKNQGIYIFFEFYCLKHSLPGGSMAKCPVFLALEVPIVTNINFLITLSRLLQEKRLWELIKGSPRKKCFVVLSKNSLNYSTVEQIVQTTWNFPSVHKTLLKISIRLSAASALEVTIGLKTVQIQAQLTRNNGIDVSQAFQFSKFLTSGVKL